MTTDLSCSNDDCSSRYDGLSSQTRTDDSARVHGWRVWRSEGLELILCPGCIGFRVRRDKPPERLDGEQPLF